MKAMKLKRAALLLTLLVMTLSAVTGGTIAWFTDTVESTDNVIKSGTLDMTVEYKKNWNDEWQIVEKDTTLFDEDALYEPGYTETVFFRVANAGNLAFKYDLAFSVEDTVIGQSVLGNEIHLSDYLEMGVYKQDEYSSGFNYADILIPNMFADRENTLKSVTMTALKEQNLVTLDEDAPVLAGEQTAQVMAVVLHMPTSVGNEANYRGETVPQIKFGLQVVATQYIEENDSFDNQYDADAEYPVMGADNWDGSIDLAMFFEDGDPAKTFIESDEYIITTAEELAGFAKAVDAGNTFEGKTVKLGRNIDLYLEDDNGERVSFNPIGYGYDVVFKGIFDGQDYTISNLYENGWALGLDYSTEGGGLFASVVDATIKNLNIDNAEIVMECIDMGTLVGYSYGNCTYENINITNSTIANYNRYTGGVVGEVNGTQTFKNVDIKDSTVSALWGTYDAALGGVIGGKWGEADITMEDCDVDVRLDAFNDACSNYQYYNYRLSGMLIGNSEEVTDGTASASYLTAANCTVTYRDWANYTYCEFEANGKGSYAAEGEWKFSRVQEGYATGGVDLNHTHDTDETHEELLVFDQLFGGDKGVRGGKTHEGVTVVYNNK